MIAWNNGGLHKNVLLVFYIYLNSTTAIHHVHEYFFFGWEKDSLYFGGKILDVFDHFMF